MKNKIILIICLILMTACTTKTATKEIDTKELIQDFKEPTIEEIPVEVGLYQNINGQRNLITTMESTYPSLQDIASFEVFYTKEELLRKDSQKNLWNDYLSKYEGIENNKIGYNIHFKTEKEEFNQTILSPKDVESIFNYIQIYLYDDIHQTTSWYDHVSEEEVTDETIYTSIKLTGSVYIDQIIGPITLTAFSYSKEMLNAENQYIGENKYKIIINRK